MDTKKQSTQPKANLEKLRRQFLKYAPGYAIEEATQAFDKIYELKAQKVISEGVYYIVLVDLVGSTKFGALHGNAKLSNRIETFVKCAISSLSKSQLLNTSIFLKEIGDAVLLVFQHFPDVLAWRMNLGAMLGRFEKHPYVIRTCIHIGEVAFQGVNPISLAVSQTFKMEKAIQDGQIGLTEPAFQVAWPSIARAFSGFSEAGKIELLGFDKKIKLYIMDINSESDLEKIIKENQATIYE